MFKKVALYGIAFGSASAAMVFIQYVNGLYKLERSFITALPVIANIVLPAIGVFLFIKSISRMKTTKPINLGKALFGSLLVCVLVAACNIAVYNHLMFNRKDVIRDYRAVNYRSIENYYTKDTTIAEEEKTEKIEAAKENFEENISTGSWGRTQFMMCLSTGMVVALLTFMWNNRNK
ncbi:MAG: DUF4199 family protein [Bacteroidetes bacterium]|nr:DUF4199 family protein [Bacteroidota bacterium]